MRRWITSLCAAALAVTACGAEEPTTSADGVFALDRAVGAEIQPIDPNRADVIPAPLLRLELQRLLTEHSDVSILAMRAAVDGDDLTAPLADLTRNTDDLTRAIGLVYGPAGANAFDQLWTSHIEFFNDYASGASVGDDEARERAESSLSDYVHDFSSFVDGATDGGVPFEAVLDALHSHVHQLLTQADAWDDRDWERAAELADEAHRHMAVVAFALANGIAQQQPVAFPGDPADSDVCAAAQLEGSLLVSADDRLALYEDTPAAQSAEEAYVTAASDASAVVARAFDATVSELPDEDFAHRRASVFAAIAASPACFSDQ